MQIGKVTLPVALQLYSVRADAAANLYGTLKRVRAMGYDGVEFAGLYGHTPAEVREVCNDLALAPISAHVPFSELVTDGKVNEKTLDDYAAIGCRYIGIPSLSRARLPGGELFEETARLIRAIAAAAAPRGITLLYHNHDFEFTKVDGKYALDLLYEALPADVLQTEIDTCWVNVGGEDPAAYLRGYAGRSPVVHLKDFAGSAGGKMYALIGVDAANEQKSKDAAGEFEYRPLGAGLQDIPEILAASLDAGAAWLVVEQDEPSLGKSPLDCARMSADYLHGLK